jgi:hypothetical protein
MSMRRRKSRPDGKALYKTLCHEIESLSLQSQAYVASRVADCPSDELRQAALDAWDKRVKPEWKDRCVLLP